MPGRLGTLRLANVAVIYKDPPDRFLQEFELSRGKVDPEGRPSISRTGLRETVPRFDPGDS